jgi:hypothetical protein
MTKAKIPKHIPVGGLCELGLSLDGETLLVISHSGRGIFLIPSGERVARDSNPVYPNSGTSTGFCQWSSVLYKTSGLWNPIAQSLLAKLNVIAPNYDNSDIRGLAITPDNRYLIAGCPDSFTIFELEKHQERES